MGCFFSSRRVAGRIRARPTRQTRLPENITRTEKSTLWEDSAQARLIDNRVNLLLLDELTAEGLNTTLSTRGGGGPWVSSSCTYTRSIACV